MRQAGRAPGSMSRRGRPRLPATACGRDAPGLQLETLAVVDAGRVRVGLVPLWLLSRHGACSLAQALGSQLPQWLLQGWTATPPAMMPGQTPGPSMTVGSLPALGPLIGLFSSALTAEELKYTDIRHIGAMIAPLHFLEVKLGKRPQPVRSELDEEEERRKRLRVKNKVVAARCQNKKKERTECLQRESEWLELMNVELRIQMQELKQEWQQLILMLNRHRPTCIVRTDSVKTLTQKATHCWSSWRRSDHGLRGGRGGGGEEEKGEEEGSRALFLAA